ncbi:MAG: winged helix-turn-helix transcriptional regulator [Thermoplasmata archaeon]|nr:MAG: winged helix-turn-helix transcriptional regulator [Thermoplasmata archaeon]
MVDDAHLELDTRKRIYEYILEVPGAHFRDINRKLGISTGVVEYHLKYLQDKGLVIARTEGRYKRFYVEGTIDSKDKSMMAILRQEIPRRIIAHVLLNPGASHKELRELFNISASTLSFHLSKLTRSGILAQERSGRQNQYRVIDEDEVARALISYRKSFLDEIVDNFVDTWSELHP